MYVTRTKKHLQNFYLDNPQDKAKFEEIINNPAVNILEKSFFNESTTDYEGESASTTERPCARLEWEICSL